jgi:hypothetical protein
MCRGTSKVSRFRLLPNDFGSPADPPVSAIAASLTKATFPAAITSGDTTPAASRRAGMHNGPLETTECGAQR